MELKEWAREDEADSGTSLLVRAADPLTRDETRGSVCHWLTGITWWLRIVNTQGENVSVKLSSTIAENGLVVILRLAIRASALLDGVLSPANISTEAKLHTKYGLEDFSAGTFEIIFHECNVQLGDINIELRNGEFPGSALPMVRDSLTANLPAQLCPGLKAIFDRASELLLRTVNGE
ncbi:UNVERIFIED_CONTAM: hypothetical protein K2H54_073842 [Gekko kuhli]